MLARTEHRRALPAESNRDRKRLRAEDGAAVVRADDVVVRRLSVVFSAVCAPASVDFLITFRGVETCIDDAEPGAAPGLAALSTAALALATSMARPPLAEVSPLDVGSVVSDLRPPQPGDEPVGGVEDDDEDVYWRDVDDFTVFCESTDLL
ncbi:hypothetical protein EI94DRAFT_1722960 [Lactarius quietus]|nr:hypothetical protein EI94DRAFT_1722960 [Lactarius quietus]